MRRSDLLSRARHRPAKRAFATLVDQTVVIVVVTVVYCGLVALLAEPALRLVYGTEFAPAAAYSTGSLVVHHRMRRRTADPSTWEHACP